MTYKLNHLIISKSEYEKNKIRGIYNFAATDLSTQKTQPTIKLVQYFVKRVGGPWGWHLRQQYSQEAIAELIQKPGIQLFLLKKNNGTIGYCLIHDEDIDLSTLFNYNTTSQQPIKIGRIEGVGLYPEKTNKTYGHFFLTEMLKKLFETGYTHTYLSSRGTNHPRVVPFYKDIMKMTLIGTETKPDDHIDTPIPHVA